MPSGQIFHEQNTGVARKIGRLRGNQDIEGRKIQETTYCVLGWRGLFETTIHRGKILFMKDSTEGIAEGQTTASAGNGLNTGVSEDRESGK